MSSLSGSILCPSCKEARSRPPNFHISFTSSAIWSHHPVTPLDYSCLLARGWPSPRSLFVKLLPHWCKLSCSLSREESSSMAVSILCDIEPCLTQMMDVYCKVWLMLLVVVLSLFFLCYRTSLLRAFLLLCFWTSDFSAFMAGYLVLFPICLQYCWLLNTLWEW